jgi:hypothetical protein
LVDLAPSVVPVVLEILPVTPIDNQAAERKSTTIDQSAGQRHIVDVPQYIERVVVNPIFAMAVVHSAAVLNWVDS